MFAEYDYLLAPEAEAISPSQGPRWLKYQPGVDRGYLLTAIECDRPAVGDACGRVSEASTSESLLSIVASTESSEGQRRRAVQNLIEQHLHERQWLQIFSQIETDLLNQMSVELPEIDTPRCRKVIVCGYYGARNTGDELILRAITQGVCRETDRIQFVVAAENPERVERVHGCQAFARRDLELADAEVAAASAVVLGGGGLWHDYSFKQAGKMLSVFDRTAISVGGYGKLPMLARMYGRPFHVFGMGVGPLADPNARQLVRFLGQQAQSIVVRDRESRKLLETIPGWSSKVEDVPDPVYGLELGQPVIPEALREVAGAGAMLAVNLRPWPAAEHCGLYEHVALALETIARRHGWTLVGVPLQGGSKHDQVVLQRVFAMIRSPNPMIVLDWTEDFSELFGVLGACHGLLAMRLHACLLGHRLGTPTLGIGYDSKVNMHFSDLDLAEQVLPISASVCRIDRWSWSD